MPVWQEPERTEGGGIRHRLQGVRTSAEVETHPAFGKSTLQVVVVLDGTSDAIVAKAKIDAEMMIGTYLQRQAVREAAR